MTKRNATLIIVYFLARYLFVSREYVLQNYTFRGASLEEDERVVGKEKVADGWSSLTNFQAMEAVLSFSSRSISVTKW